MSLAPRDYVELPRIPRDWKVADVGPGAYPLKRADVFIDRSEEILEPLRNEGHETLLSSIENGLTEIPDKAFDYVWCSHVLEHVDDPLACAATLSRIARSGTLVVPSAIKEGVFNFEEPTHRWLILPHPANIKPIFIKQNREFIRRLQDSDVQKITCRLFRTGTSENTLDDQYLRQWYATHEVDLDVIVHWSGNLDIQVIG